MSLLWMRVWQQHDAVRLEPLVLQRLNARENFVVGQANDRALLLRSIYFDCPSV
jgi:hypothetical protein